jgi:hypothetical protein
MQTKPLAERTECRAVGGAFIPLRAFQIGLSLTAFRFLAEMFLEATGRGNMYLNFDDVGRAFGASNQQVNLAIKHLLKCRVIALKPDGSGYVLRNERHWGCER